MRPRKTMEEALGETYLIKASKNGKGYASGKILFPKCLIGKKINISVVEDAEEEEEVPSKNVFQRMWEGSNYSK